MTADARDLARRYFEAWKAKDFDALRGILADDVITWFELHTDVATPTRTANWTHVENGKIARIRAIFDPREILAGRQS